MTRYKAVGRRWVLQSGTMKPLVVFVLLCTLLSAAAAVSPPENLPFCRSYNPGETCSPYTPATSGDGPRCTSGEQRCQGHCQEECEVALQVCRNVVRFQDGPCTLQFPPNHQCELPGKYCNSGTERCCRGTCHSECEPVLPKCRNFDPQGFCTLQFPPDHQCEIPGKDCKPGKERCCEGTCHTECETLHNNPYSG